MDVEAVCKELDALRVLLAELLEDCATGARRGRVPLARDVSDALGMAGELLADMLDADPALSDEYATPVVAQILERIYARSHEDSVLDALGEEVRAFAPISVARRVSSPQPPLNAIADLWRTGVASCSVADIAFGLTSQRRWRRVVAARSVAEVGGPDLLDAGTGDVDERRVQHWIQAGRPAVVISRTREE